MLRNLSVRNFAIIERLDLEFGPALNVLTGETGTGKSIIMGALNLLLGSRSGSEMVRMGADRAHVDAVFDVTGSSDLILQVESMGFVTEDGSLLLSREITTAGKSSCRIGGRPATVSQLREIGELLVDLHGQHEHQSLLAVANHLELLDEWGGKAIQGARISVSQLHSTLTRLHHEKEAIAADARERAQLLDLYTFQTNEIKSAGLQAGEESELLAEQARISNAQKLSTAASAAAKALNGGERGAGVLGSLALAVKALEEAAAIDNALAPAMEAIRTATYELIETERDLTHYQDTIEFNDEKLDQIEDRLELLRTLKRKYGDSIADVIEYGSQAAEKMDGLVHADERSAALDDEIGKVDKRLHELATNLTELRRKAAKDFQSITLSELRDLAMEKARFEVLIEPSEISPRGADRIEFLIATNPGEPLRPLAKVASGGEISRVMLAIKSAMARQEALPTMVFDEIDVGVGGRTASTIAQKMSHLARSAQILCITHLAQIASQGDRHYSIEKHSAGDRTVVTVTPLDESQRIAEIARMIGGTSLTETVLQHAKEMLSSSA